jgi:hypothetical protein
MYLTIPKLNCHYTFWGKTLEKNMAYIKPGWLKLEPALGIVKEELKIIT